MRVNLKRDNRMRNLTLLFTFITLIALPFTLVYFSAFAIALHMVCAAIILCYQLDKETKEANKLFLNKSK